MPLCRRSQVVHRDRYVNVCTTFGQNIEIGCKASCVPPVRLCGKEQRRVCWFHRRVHLNWYLYVYRWELTDSVVPYTPRDRFTTSRLGMRLNRSSAKGFPFSFPRSNDGSCFLENERSARRCWLFYLDVAVNPLQWRQSVCIPAGSAIIMIKRWVGHAAITVSNLKLIVWHGVINALIDALRVGPMELWYFLERYGRSNDPQNT